MAVVPEDFLTTGFSVLLEDSLKKCQFTRAPTFSYHEHWINSTKKEYHVEVVVRANDSPTSWFFEGPQMATLLLAVETAALKALTRLRDLLPELASEPATDYQPYRKEGDDESSAPAPPMDEGLPSVSRPTSACVLTTWHSTWPRSRWIFGRNSTRPRNSFAWLRRRRTGSRRMVHPLESSL